MPAASQPAQKPAPQQMDATPQAPGAAPQSKSKYPPGFVPSETLNAPSGGSGGSWDTPPEGKISKAWHWLNTPPGTDEDMQKAMGVNSWVKSFSAAKDQQISKGHPVRAALDAIEAGVPESAAKMVHSALTPLSLGLAALSAGESLWGTALAEGGTAAKLPSMIRIPLRATQSAAGAYFGGQGAVAALTPQQPGEDQPSEVERRFAGAGTALLAGSGEYAVMKDSVRSFLRNRLKLSDNLADKVTNNIEQMNNARAEGEKKISGIKEESSQKQRAIDAKKTQAIGAAESDLENSLTSLEGQQGTRISDTSRSVDRQVDELQQHIDKMDDQKLAAGKQVIVDTAHTLANEEARMRAEFQEIGKNISDPITNASAVRSIITEELSKHGVKESELPGAATAALGKGASGQDMVYQGHTLDPSRPGDLRLIMELKRQGAIQPEGEIFFNDLTRVKNDLYETAYRSKDGALRASLFASAERISDMQESAAKEAGLGDRYAKAKTDYMQMKRGIGSDVVMDWLSAADMQEQMLAGKIGDKVFGKIPKLERGANAAAIRTILKSVGVDTSTFDKTLSEIETAQNRLDEVPKEGATNIKLGEKGVKKQTVYEKARATESKEAAERKASNETRALGAETGERIGAVESDTDKTVKEAEAKGQIIPGKTSTELAGISNEHLLRQRMESMLSKSSVEGVPHLGRLMMGVYGLMEVMRGRLWGAGMLGYVIGREEIPNLLKDKDFQDWLIRESGAEPSNKLVVSKLRKGIEGLYPIFRELAKSQVGSSASEGGKPQDLSPTPLGPLPDGTGAYSSPAAENLVGQP